MDTITAEINAPAAQEAVVVKVAVCHGDYRADFYGSGSNILEAAEAASSQSSYSSGLFDTSSNLYEVRTAHRADLWQALTNGEVYRGFGWCDFSRIA